jgi:predicted choloylglycine hydrolase
MPNDTLNGIKVVLESQGLQIISDKKINLDMDIARQLARYDLQNLSGVKPNDIEKRALSSSQHFRILAFDKVRVANENKLIKKIEENLDNYGKLKSDLEFQDRFWG